MACCSSFSMIGHAAAGVEITIPHLDGVAKMVCVLIGP
jgi:hypothetical protein